MDNSTKGYIEELEFENQYLSQIVWEKRQEEKRREEEMEEEYWDIMYITDHVPLYLEWVIEQNKLDKNKGKILSENLQRFLEMVDSSFFKYTTYFTCMLFIESNEILWQFKFDREGDVLGEMRISIDNMFTGWFIDGGGVEKIETTEPVTAKKFLDRYKVLWHYWIDHKYLLSKTV